MVEDASKIGQEIASGAAELAGTVQALVEKADVQGRVRDALGNAEQLQHKASERAGQLTGVAKSGSRSYLAGGAGLLMLVMMILFVRKGRSNH